MSGVLFSLLFHLEQILLLANSEDPDQTSDLGLHCLPMSQKWDARLIWVNQVQVLQYRDMLNQCHRTYRMSILTPVMSYWQHMDSPSFSYFLVGMARNSCVNSISLLL